MRKILLIATTSQFVPARTAEHDWGIEAGNARSFRIIIVLPDTTAKFIWIGSGWHKHFTFVESLVVFPGSCYGCAAHLLSDVQLARLVIPQIVPATSFATFLLKSAFRGMCKQETRAGWGCPSYTQKITFLCIMLRCVPESGFEQVYRSCATTTSIIKWCAQNPDPIIEHIGMCI